MLLWPHTGRAHTWWGLQAAQVHWLPKALQHVGMYINAGCSGKMLLCTVHIDGVQCAAAGLVCAPGRWLQRGTAFEGKGKVGRGGGVCCTTCCDLPALLQHVCCTMALPFYYGIGGGHGRGAHGEKGSGTDWLRLTWGAARSPGQHSMPRHAVLRLLFQHCWPGTGRCGLSGRVFCPPAAFAACVGGGMLPGSAVLVLQGACPGSCCNR